jgi:hypothetical protein
MAIDWNKFESDLDNAVGQASNEVDKRFSSTISSLTRLKDSEIDALFPKPEDKENLIELIRLVNSSSDHNIKVNQLIEKSEKLSGSVLKLLGTVV